jgi:glyoxylase-like metal-dependent hydrolase (beta-lactamase superfamily II)
MADDGLWEVIPFDAGSFTFPEDEEYSGEEGVVVAHLLRSAEGHLFLFDTGIGAGHPELDARYHPVERHLADALAALGHGIEEVVAATNCHLHADHAGQNHRVPGVPIYVQSAERAAASRPGYTVAEWVDAPGVRYVPIDGDHVVLPGITILASPGHTAGHQSLLVTTRRGRVLLAGQAVYSRDEWEGRAGREGRTTARDARYDETVARLRGLDAAAIHFAHDKAVVASESGL